MKKLEAMNIEKLLEFENKNRVLSFGEFLYTRNYLKYKLMDYTGYLTEEKMRDTYRLLEYDYVKYRKKLPIYQIIYTLYHKILDDFVLEIKDSTMEKDPLSLAILLGDYLIPSGFLSYTPTFHKTDSEKLFSLDEKYDYDSYIEGAYVFASYGCCRHVTSLISDLLHKMNISNDIIPCIEETKETILFDILNHTIVTHAILGYEMNGKYHLADTINGIYNLSISKDYIETNTKRKIVLDYTSTYLFQQKLYWNPNLVYGTITEEEIKEKKTKVRKALQIETDRFQKFKKNHFELYKKLAYLVPLELERTTEKEIKKVNRI